MSEEKSPAKPKPVIVAIARRDHRGDAPRTEEFEVAIDEEATLHDLLVEIAAHPVPRKGARVAPPAWEAHCLEGSCGGCAIRAGGRAVLACTTQIAEVTKRRGVVVLEPLGVFPVVRDLIVDHAERDRDIDAMTFAANEKPRDEPTGDAAPEVGVAVTVAITLGLGGCIACGACLDACPEAHLAGGFVGAEAIVRNRRVHAATPTTPAERRGLDDALLRPGGIAECGHAQSCVEVCPVAIPITEALADASRAATARLLPRWLRR